MLPPIRGCDSGEDTPTDAKKLRSSDITAELRQNEEETRIKGESGLYSDKVPSLMALAYKKGVEDQLQSWSSTRVCRGD